MRARAAVAGAGRAAFALAAALGASVPGAAQQEPAGSAPAASSAEQVEASAEDWAKDVERACTSPRYGLRLAASRKVAKGGAPAVEAVRAFAKANGGNAIPVALVESFADLGGNDTAVLSLLEGWARDRDFYWRAQAMRGLALRAGDDDALADRYGPLFAKHVHDPAWLTRVFARFGAHRAWVRGVAEAALRNELGIPDPYVEHDPRARTKLAALLVEPETLLEALGDERTFLGDPWGRRRANEAFQALKEWAGEDFGYRVDAPYADNRDAIAAFAKRVRERTGSEPAKVEHLADPATEFAGGIEVLSCARGDLFVRWTKDGVLHFGLGGEPVVRLPAKTWERLAAELAGIALQTQHGVVICDRLRFVATTAPGDAALRPDSAPQAAIAPGAMPGPLAVWLQQLAAAAEEAGGRESAAALRDRLQQFVVH